MKVTKKLKYSRMLFVGLLFMVSGEALRAQFAEDALRFSQFNVPVGGRLLGMGNASVGVADDYAALFTNPAGLALLRSFELSVGLSNSSFKNDVAFYGVSSSSDDRVTHLNKLGIVYPVPTVRGALTFAFGFARVANYSTTASFSGFNPHSSIVESMTPNVNLYAMSANDLKDFLDTNIPFQIFLSDTLNGRLHLNVTDSVQQEGTVREGGGLNNWSLGGAIDIAKDLSLGVGLNLLSGRYTYDRVYVERDSRNIYRYAPPFDFDWLRFESRINSDITGYNVLFGLMYRKQGRFKLGVTVRTPTYYEISEDFTDIADSYFDNGDHYQIKIPASTKYSIKTPAVITGGISMQATDWLVLAGDAEYTDWTQMEFTNDNPDLIDENRIIRGIFRSTTNLRGGAEVTLWKLGVQFRGGIVYNPSPYKDDPKDFDQLYYTAGLGFAVDRSVAINVSYSIGTWKTFRDNYSISGFPAASRTSESVSTNAVIVSLSYRF